MSFAFLKLPPRLPVEAELLPTMFGDVQLRISTQTKAGTKHQDYAVTRGESDDMIAESITLRHDDTTYQVQVRHTGEANCTCEAFEFERCAELGRMCKHVYSLVVTGLITSVEAPAHDPRYCEARP